ncbi:hypothetical protein JN853_10015 [Pseudomonas syringae pv. actinidiae ICMP 9853]|nr:hypothetical protein JN853_10015 [Pseudomonas syringae pv. actinidiae ICMP 9853]
MYEYLGFCPEGVGASGGYDGCDGLRSGPETDHLGCVWHTEVAGFAAGSRQFAVVNFFRTPQSVIVRPLAAHIDWAARSPVSSAIAPRCRTARCNP